MARSIVRIELNPAAVEKVLKAARPVVAAAASRIAAAAGPGFETSSSIGRKRARATVWAATPEARLAEAKDRRLTRALDAGRS